MVVVKEIVLAIDPELRKVEDVLLWKNKLKTCGIFTFCHFLFWLFQNFNIRTFCVISCVALFLHLLDAYRTKRRKEIIKIQQIKPNIIDNLSALGKCIILVNDKFQLIWSTLGSIKQRNRLQYFLIMFTFWSMATIVGIKIRGVYMAYLLFWIIFFMPPIFHYDVPRKLICKAIPLLEQLDHSMKYSRRSVLNKDELLVDVKIPTNESHDEEIENEYLRSFKLNDLDKLKPNELNLIEKLNDDYDDEEVELHQVNSNNENGGGGDDEEDEIGIPSFSSNLIMNLTTTSNNNNNTDDDTFGSFLPDSSQQQLPNVSSVVNDDDDEAESMLMKSFGSSSIEPDRVLRKRGAKVRPKLSDYYSTTNSDDDRMINSISKRNVNVTRGGSQQQQQQQQDVNDIEHTFDFLEEEY